MEKNCKTCKYRFGELTLRCAQCAWTDEFDFWERPDISPDLCCGITDSVVSQGEKREYITCAANWFNDGKEYLHQPTNIKEGFVVCGHRHHNVFMTVSLIRGEDFRVSDYGKVTQGFLTSHDRFVDREEAGVIAFREKQITKWTNCLFSEDLY